MATVTDDVVDLVQDLLDRVAQLEQRISSPTYTIPNGSSPTFPTINIGNWRTGDPTIPIQDTIGTPTGLTAHSTTTFLDVAIDASWIAPADNSAVQYQVTIATKDGAGNYTLMDARTTASNSIHLDGLTPGVTYGIKVAGINRIGVVSTPAPASGYYDVVTAPDSSLPAAPAGLVATAGTTSVMLTWSDNAEADVARGAGIYEVQYSTTNIFTSPTTVRVSATIAAFTGLTPGQTYYFRVRAIDSSNNPGPYSSTASATPGAAGGAASDGSAPASSPAATVLGGVGYLYVSWVPIANADAVTYDVHLSTTSGFAPNSGTLVTSTPASSAFVKTLPGGGALAYGTTYYARLVARDLDGSAAAGAQGSATMVQATNNDIATLSGIKIKDGAAPSSSPTPTIVAGIGTLYAYWSAVTNNDFVTYEVHVSATNGFAPSGATLVAQTTDTYQVIRNLTGGAPLVYGTTYYVKLIAKDLDGAAAASAQGSGAPVQVNVADIVAGSITSASGLIGALDAGSITTGTLAAGRIGASTIDVSKLNVTIGGGNMLSNSSFEDGTLTGWAALSSTGVAVNTVHFSPGSWSAKLTSTAAGQIYLYTTAAAAPQVQPGRKYTASAYYRPDAASPNRQVLTYINFYDINSALTGQVVSDGSKTQVAGDWVRDVITGTVPANTNKALVFTSIVGTAVGEIHYVDNVQIENGDVVTAYSPRSDEILPGTINANMIASHTITAAQILGNTITANEMLTGTITAASGIIGSIDAGVITVGTLDANRIGASSIQASQLRVSPGGDNLVLNSSFEEPTIVWWGNPGAYTVSLDSTTSYNGTKSYKAVAANVTDTNCFYWNFTIPQPGTYTFSLWVLTPTYTGTAGNFAFDREAGTATMTGPSTATLPAVSAGGGWQRVIRTRTFSTAGTATLVLRVPSIVVGNVVNVDAVQAEVGDMATGYKPSVSEILPGTVQANMITANSITSDRINATVGLDATLIKFNTMSGDRITANTLDITAIKTSTLSARTITLASDGAIAGGSNPFGVGSAQTGFILNGSAMTMYKAGAQTFRFDFSNGNAFFSGDISGSTGTFSGALSGATGSFAGALSGATGTFSGTVTVSATVPTSTLTGNSLGGFNLMTRSRPSGMPEPMSTQGGATMDISGAFEGNPSWHVNIASVASGTDWYKGLTHADTITLQDNTTYTLSGWFYLGALTTSPLNLSLRATLLNSSNAYVSEAHAQVNLTVGGWVRASTQFATGTTITRCTISTQFPYNLAQVCNYYLYGIQLERGTVLTAYSPNVIEASQNLVGGGVATGLTTINGRLTVGAETGKHVTIGSGDGKGTNGIRMFDTDGTTVLIDLNIAGTPTIFSSIINAGTITGAAYATSNTYPRVRVFGTGYVGQGLVGTGQPAQVLLERTAAAGDWAQIWLPQTDASLQLWGMGGSGTISLGTTFSLSTGAITFNGGSNVGAGFTFSTAGNLFAGNGVFGLNIGNSATLASTMVTSICTSGTVTDIEFNYNSTVTLTSGSWLNFHVNGIYMASINGGTKINAGTKTFVIDHPVKKDRYLVHAAVEGPSNDVYYRGRAQLRKGTGTAVVKLPDYFTALCDEDSATVMLTPLAVIHHHGEDPVNDPCHKYGRKMSDGTYEDCHGHTIVPNLVASGVEDGEFHVGRAGGFSEGDTDQCVFDWMVIATRKDVAPLVVEPRRRDVTLKGDGPYKYLVAA